MEELGGSQGGYGEKWVFMVRLRSTEKRANILKGNHIFFDNKPIIVKPWKPDIDIFKEDVKILPTWAHLHKDLKYWGKDVLMKLLARLGSGEV